MLMKPFIAAAAWRFNARLKEKHNGVASTCPSPGSLLSLSSEWMKWFLWPTWHYRQQHSSALPAGFLASSMEEWWSRAPHGAAEQQPGSTHTPAAISSIFPNPSHSGLHRPGSPPPFSRLQSSAFPAALGRELPFSGPLWHSYAI